MAMEGVGMESKVAGSTGWVVVSKSVAFCSCHRFRHRIWLSGIAWRHDWL